MKAIPERIRSFGFWISDTFRGGSVKYHVGDIDFILKNHESSDAVKRIDDRKQKILKHATETTLFYKEFRGCTSIDSFPVINKNIIRERFNDFMSDKYPVRDLTCVTTSGSTGTPFKLYHDRDKRIRHTADTIYFNKCAGFELGMRLYFIRRRDERFRMSRLKSWTRNIVMVNSLDLKENKISSLIKELNNDRSRIVVMGYATSIESVCNYMKSKNLHPVRSNVITVIPIAEAINESTASLIEKFFTAPVCSRYATNENGIIAQQFIAGGREYIINTPGFHLEIMNFDNDSPEKDGNLGRIVLTDYFNYAMPLIRYDTGDIGVADTKYKNDCTYRVLTRLEGRKMDMIYDTSGRFVSSIDLLSGFYKYQDIKQFQIIQSGRGKYKLVLNCSDPYPGINDLTVYLKGYLGNDATIETEYVNEIPLLSSGKRKIVLNTYKSSPDQGR